jgi:hypothetical protein
VCLCVPKNPLCLISLSLLKKCGEKSLDVVVVVVRNEAVQLNFLKKYQRHKRKEEGACVCSLRWISISGGKSFDFVKDLKNANGYIFSS